MALFSEKKNPPANNAQEVVKTDAPLSFSKIILLICLFGLCLAYLLSAAVIAGRFIEYHVPLFLMELPSGMFKGVICTLFLAATAGLSLQRSLNADGSPKSVLSRWQKISYFFSLLATLCFTAYSCAILVHFFRTKVFFVEYVYLVFLYTCVLAVHFRTGKSSLAHMFTSAAFVLILVVTAFYSGIASAKIENRKIGYINSEPFLLVCAQKQNYILAGYDAKTNRSNNKIVILPRQNEIMEHLVFSPVRYGR